MIGYYSTTEGERLDYICYNAKGNVEGYYSVTTGKPFEDKGNYGIIYNYRFLEENKEPLFGDDGCMEMRVVLTKGDTQSFMEDAKKSMAIKDFVPLGDVSKIPVGIKTGDKIQNSAIQIIVGKLGGTFQVSDRDVLSEESISTPAGTFNCIKCNEKQVTKIMVGSTKRQFTSWYAVGIGVVKQFVYDKNGKLIRSLELVGRKQ